MKIPPIVQILAAGTLAWGASQYVPAWKFGGAPVLILSVVFALAGAGFLTVALNIFSIHDTTFDPLDPSRAQNLVVTGVYRFTRNPMYLGMALLLLAWCLYLGNVVAFISIPIFVVAMNELQIRAEEAALLNNFGEEYAQYRMRVRRWI